MKVKVMALRGRPHLACLLFLLSACLHRLCSGQCQTAGRFGEDCQHQCHCQQACDFTTGICPTHCTEGYEGPTCQKYVGTAMALLQCPPGCQSGRSRSVYKSVLLIGIAIGIALCLAVLVVSLVVFCFVRRYQLGRDENAALGPQSGEDTTQNRDASVHYNASSRPAAEEGNGPYESLDASSRNPDVPNEYVSIRTRNNAVGATEARGASAQDTASTRPAAVDGNNPYESLDTSTRNANVPSDYVSLGSRTN